MPSRSTWGLVAAAIAATVSVTAAVLVVSDHEPSTSVTARDTPDVRPTVRWTLDAATYLDRPFGAFSDPRGGASFGAGQTGFVSFGSTLATLAGSPTDSSALGDAVMIGIDADTGAVRWRSPADDLEGCSGTPLDGALYCYAHPASGSALVRYDLGTGRVERRAVDEFVFGITTADGTLYVAEGNPEDNEVRVHAGTYDDISERWERDMDIGAPWEGVYSDQVLAVTDGVGLVQTGGEMVQFDSRSGDERWKPAEGDCVSNAALHPGGVVVVADGNCSGQGGPRRQVLRGPTGKILATTTSGAVQNLSVDARTNPRGFVLLGDEAVDRRSGKRRWSSTELSTGQNGSLGTATAIVGSTVYVTGGDPQTEAGVDMLTGKQRWSRPTTDPTTPRAGAGNVLVGDDGSALRAIDVRTGRRVWTLPFRSLDPDPEVFAHGGTTIHHDDGWIHSSDRRIVGLDEP